MFLVLVLGTLLAALAAGTAKQADAALAEKIVFASERTTGTDVNNPTGDLEIFKMNPDGTSVRQLTYNQAEDFGPTLSPDKTKVAYVSNGVQISNPQGDNEVYVMNASDGKGKKNLSNNGSGVYDYYPVFSPGGKRIAYQSNGVQTSNPEGDYEIYLMRALDGSAKKNLSDNGIEVAGASPVDDFDPDFSPTGDKIAYKSQGKQTSNPEGDDEVYVMNALDGSAKKNLSNNGDGVYDSSADFSFDGTKIAYGSQGEQTSNPEGDTEIYRMSALDGTGQKNLTDNGDGINDFGPVFSPGGERIAYTSHGKQTSNEDGDYEVYRLRSLDGTRKKNLSDNGLGVDDLFPFFSSSEGTRVFYESQGVQTSNPEGDIEIYRTNTLDGTGKKNLTHNGAGVYDGIYPD